MSKNTVFTSIVAENYEKYMAPMFFEPYAKDMANRLSSKKINSLLEIACGTGQVTRLLREKLPEARIVGTDLNPGMLELAKKIIKPEDKIEWQIANAQELAFEDNTFDAVVCQFGLMFVPDKQKAVNEAYRVLNPGGILLFNTWDSLETNPVSKIANNVIASFFKDFSFDFYKIPFSMYDPVEIESLLQLAGFKNISVENVQINGYSATAEDAAKALCEGTPAYIEICQKDEKLLPEIRKSAVMAITKEFGAASLKIPNAAWVAQGLK